MLAIRKLTFIRLCVTLALTLAGRRGEIFLNAADTRTLGHWEPWEPAGPAGPAVFSPVLNQFIFFSAETAGVYSECRASDKL